MAKVRRHRHMLRRLVRVFDRVGVVGRGRHAALHGVRQQFEVDEARLWWPPVAIEPVTEREQRRVLHGGRGGGVARRLDNVLAARRLSRLRSRGLAVVDGAWLVLVHARLQVLDAVEVGHGQLREETIHNKGDARVSERGVVGVEPDRESTSGDIRRWW